ncbi:MAG: carboxymuconolactone decarboxylase family protein [Alphaproteobacteria bacterium]|nr:carboxymuconolactone decarboxylase family protein [Alphaproteobacteria bacterium]MCK5518356.1 carboxymuconolactone decarboxylase family protein [Alphaproteobacteria bacterium]MCK5658898.1 carboxymuconolactone decarboxylase family protein [Alphaproteobacteria bacterium]
MTAFTIHTAETAPENSKVILKNIECKLGFVPNIMAEMAESPALLKGFSELSTAAATCSLSPTEVEVVQMTISSMNNCTYCLAAHKTMAGKNGVSNDVLDCLCNDTPLNDPKLEALRTFSQNMLKKMGWIDENDLAAFTEAGYTKAQAMEVLLNLSVAVITNYANHITKTPLDKAFEPNKVEDRNPCCTDSCCAA